MGFDDTLHASLDDFAERQDIEIPDELPLMAVRDVVIQAGLSFNLGI